MIRYLYSLTIDSHSNQSRSAKRAYRKLTRRGLLADIGGLTYITDAGYAAIYRYLSN